MKKLTTLFLFLGLSVSLVLGQTKMQKFESELDAFYKKYVSNGKVNYGAIKRAEIESLVTQVGELNIGTNPTIKKAFYINAYNVLVISTITKAYGSIKSPLDIPGLFDTKKFKVSGVVMTLDLLEKKHLFGIDQDPRIHFACVCAAKGCPEIYGYSYKPKFLDKQLDLRAKETLNDSYYVKVDATNKKIVVSEIFKWYKDDFTKGGKSIIQYINQYREDGKKIPESYKVTYSTYDWKLND